MAYIPKLEPLDEKSTYGEIRENLQTSTGDLHSKATLPLRECCVNTELPTTGHIRPKDDESGNDGISGEARIVETRVMRRHNKVNVHTRQLLSIYLMGYYAAYVLSRMCMCSIHQKASRDTIAST